MFWNGNKFSGNLWVRKLQGIGSLALITHVAAFCRILCEPALVFIQNLRPDKNQSYHCTHTTCAIVDRFSVSRLTSP